MKTFKLTLIRTYETTMEVEAMDEKEAGRLLAGSLEDGSFYAKELEDPNCINESYRVEEVIEEPILDKWAHYDQAARSFMDFLNAKYELEIMCSLDEYCSLCPPNLLTKEETDLIDAFVNTRYNLN